MRSGSDGGGRPRVRVLIRRFHPIVGGMERQCRQLCARWAAAGLEIEVWTRHIDAGSPETEIVDGVPVRRYRPGGLGRRGEYGSLVPMAAGLVAERDRYDVVMVFGSGWLAAAAGLAASAVERPWLFRPATSGDVTRYLDPRAMPAGGPIRRVLRGYFPPPTWRAAILRRAYRAIAVSDDIAAELGAWGWANDRVAVIPNGVDTEAFRPASAAEKAAARARVSLPDSGPVALFLGRLVQRKGVLDLVEAWRALAGRGSPGTLAIVGTGAGQEDSVEAEVRRAVEPAASAGEAGRRVVLSGSVQDPLPWLQAADVLVLPSRAEGMSNALLEGMASGLAVVATDLPANRAVLGQRYGGLVPVGDVPALTTALAAILADDGLRARRGRALSTRALRDYGLDQTAQRYRALFAAALEGN